MYFLQNGNPGAVRLYWRDMDIDMFCSKSESEPTGHPKFVQFSSNSMTPMIAVSEEGEVWVVYSCDDMEKIPFFDNIKSVHVHHPGYFGENRYLSLMTKSGRLMTAMCSNNFAVIWTINHQYPEQVVQVSSPGDLLRRQLI